MDESAMTLSAFENRLRAGSV